MQRYKILLVSMLAIGVTLFSVTPTFAFNGPSSNPPTGSGSLYLDTNANLGIGTTNPTPTNLATGRFFTIGTTTNPGLYLRDNDTGAGKYVIYVKSNGNLAFFDDKNNAERFYIATSGDVYVVGNMYANAFVGALSGALNASNVSSGVFGSGQGNGAFAFPASLGVGTSSQTGLPSTLTVYGTGRFTGTSTASGFCLGGNCKTSWTDYWILNGSDLYASSTSWDIGIGTTTPAYDLTVSGQIYSTGSSTASAFCLAGNCQTSWSNLGQWITGSGGIYYTGNVSVGTTTVGTYPLYVATSTDSLFALKRIGATYPTIFKQGTNGVLVINNANTDTLTLNSGKIGVGTTTPTYTLTVVGTGSFSEPVFVGTPTDNTHAATKAYVDTAIGGITGGNLWSQSGSYLYPSSTSWNVGIGTTTPAYALSVYSTSSPVKFYRDTLTSTGGIYSGGMLERIMTGGTATNGTGVGFYFKSPDSAGNSTFTGLFGGALSTVTNGSEIGDIIFGASYHGADPWQQQHLIIRATGENSGNVLIPNGSLGIASSSPGYKLTVVGTGYFSQPVIVGTPTDNIHAATKAYVDTAVGGITGGNLWAQSGSYLYPSSTSWKVGIGTTTPSQLLTVVGTSTFWGNVGIGTASPTGELTVMGTFEVKHPTFDDNNAKIKYIFQQYGTLGMTMDAINKENKTLSRWITGTTAMWLSVGNDAARELWITTEGNSPIRFATNNGNVAALTNERMRILGNGNIGIGTTTPEYGLTVVGTGYFSQPIIVGTPTGDTHAATKAYVDTAVGGITGGNLWIQSSSYLYPSSTSWRVGIGTTTPSQPLTVVGTSTFWGNVGIGTASPSLKLEVLGDFKLGIGGSSGSGLVSGSGDTVSFRNSSGDYGMTYTGGGSGSLLFNGNSSASLGSSSNIPLYLKTNNTTALTINTSQNVGIASTTPGYTLTVVGTGYFSQPIIVGTPTENTHAATKAYVDTAVSGAGGYWSINGTSLYPTSTSYKLGIGTTTPAYNLTVSGQIYSTGSSTASAFCLAGVCQTSWSNLGQWTTASGGIYYTGNVSVGTTTVGTYPLYVATSTDSLFALKRIGATYPTIFKQGTNGVLVINNANTDTLTLSGGNVGVGTTTPSAKLNSVATTEQLRLSYNAANYFKTTVGSTGDVTFDAVGTSPRFSFSDYVGIASTTPGYNLTVVGTGYFSQPVIVGTPTGDTHAATKAYVDASGGGNWTVSSGIIRPSSTSWSVGIATTTFATSTYKLSVAGDVYLGDGGAGTDLVVYGGSGKIDAGTIDPVYTIGGKRYATFMAGMTGVKEETTGIVNVRCQKSNVKCSTVIDFKNLDEGTDLWLFSKTTNLEKNFDEMVVLLTPAFNGHVWYEVDSDTLTLSIFAESSTSYKLKAKSYPISYRLTAPRFDWEAWGNRSDAPHEGFNLDKLIFSDGKVDIRALIGN